MNAYEIPMLRFSALSSEAVARRRFVKLDSNGKALQTGAGEAAIGVSGTDSTAADQVLDILDGIVIVEAGAAVAIGVAVQSDALGRATTRTNGVALGIALTASAAAGEMISVKVPYAAATSVASLFVSSYAVADLEAGVNLANVPIFTVPTGYKFTLLDAVIIPNGADDGIDVSNTCVISIKEANNVVATKTYNNVADTGVAFPDTGVADSLGAINNASNLVAGKVLCLNVTNGSTANTPALVVQLTGTLVPA